MRDLATKISDTIFCYHLVGLELNILYNVNSQDLILTESSTGAPLELLEKDKEQDFNNLTFEDFVLIARNIYMEYIELFN